MRSRPLKKWELIEVFSPIPVPVTYLRYLLRNQLDHSLQAGRYVVEQADRFEVLLAKADWDQNGNLTFHSTKHHFRISGTDNVKKLQDALSAGPFDWTPED